MRTPPYSDFPESNGSAEVRQESWRDGGDVIHRTRSRCQVRLAST